MKVLRQLLVKRWRKGFSVASILLILVYVGASYFATGPILEGYQIEFASRSNGYAGFFPSIILRPLSVLPNWFAIGLSRTGINGYWVITTLLILIRVLAVSLLRTQLGRLFWPVLIFAVFLPTWPASLNERFLPAQLGSSLLLLAYASSKLKYIDSSITFLLAFFSFLAYPTLILIPLIIGLMKKSGLIQKKFPPHQEPFAIYLSVTIYALAILIVKVLVPKAYDVQSTGVPSFLSLKNLFLTAFFRYPLISIAFLVFIFCFLQSSGFRTRGSSIRTAIIFAILPLASLTYSGNVFHTNDPERIFFPMTILLLLLLLEFEFHPKVDERTSGYLYPSLAIVLISTLFAFSNQFSGIKSLLRNQKVVTEINSLLEGNSHEAILVIRDYSGQMGDINSFFADTLTYAINPKHKISSVVICIPKEVLARQKFHKRYPLPGPQKCTDLVSEGNQTIVELTADLKALKVELEDSKVLD